MNVGAGGVSRDGIDIPIAGPSASSNERHLTPIMATEQSFEDEFERYGQPVFDDSSTIGSGIDNDDESWQRGSSLDDYDDDVSSVEEQGVTFSPRRHAHNNTMHQQQ